jgi:hypothetical protein
MQRCTVCTLRRLGDLDLDVRYGSSTLAMSLWDHTCALLRALGVGVRLKNWASRGVSKPI